MPRGYLLSTFFFSSFFVEFSGQFAFMALSNLEPIAFPNLCNFLE